MCITNCYGLQETKLVSSRHHAPCVIAVMEEWLYRIESFTQWDHLSLSFALWENHRRVADSTIQHARTDDVNFCVFEHVRK